MKNKLIVLFSIFFLSLKANAENLLIQSKNISIDKKKALTIFKKDVFIKTQDGNEINADMAEYDKNKGFLKLKDNIIAVDVNKNTIETNYAEYDENKKIFISKGKTKILTSENYIIEGEDITLNNEMGFIKSEKKTIITDEDENKIYLDNFNYLTSLNIFKSIGLIKIEDLKGNSSEFSQIYIDTKKKEIIGTDIKAFINDENFKANKRNKPRIFANTMSINKDFNIFTKSIFTQCDYRKNDKCPPWTIQSSKMLHDRKKKTIYYDNAVIKVYDIPIFYLPKLSHPDPSVDRRSGFLPPLFSDSQNLGAGLAIPFFWAIDRNKDFTFTNKLYVQENPLFLGEYRHAFEKSNLILDLGFTEGYKKTSATKKSGDRSHFFAEFVKNFYGKNNSENNFTFKAQDVSDRKYLKLYKIKSNLVDYNQDNIENSLNFTHENEDFFLGLNSSVYKTLKDNFNDEYEYIFPEITFDKNLFSNNELGYLDLQTNLKVHNYDTNKTTKFLVNDFDWNIKNLNFKNGIKSELKSLIKNVNYEAKNVDNLKEDTNYEIYGAFGYFSELELYKEFNQSIKHSFTPKTLIRYAPGQMRKETGGSRLNPDSIFTLNRLNNINNFESGLSATLGFDYNIKSKGSELNISAGQIIQEKENKNMPSSSSLDDKLSDFVGKVNYNMNDNFKINYDFNLDQNFKDLNYNEINTQINFNPIKFDFSYLEEKKHIGNQEYFKTKINVAQNEKGNFAFETKRNLITNSAEYYNLSYEYLNDCLRAGLVYRREFYNDSELEPENSLMFTITLVPFGNISSPSFSQ